MEKIARTSRSFLMMTFAWIIPVVLIPGCITAQQTSATPPTSATTGSANLSTKKRSVTLNVIVTDGKSTPVAGLTKSDFSLSEDTQPQTIDDFQATNVQGFTTVTNPTWNSPRIVLLLDELNSTFDQISFARNYLHKFFKENGGKLAQPTMFVALTGTGLVMLHDYTQDATALDSALHQHKTLVAYQMREGGGVGHIQMLNQSLDAIRQIASSTGDIPANKTLVWIGPGFSLIGQPNISRNNADNVLQMAIKISDQIFRAHITINSVDPRGASGVRAYGNLWFSHFDGMASTPTSASLANLDLRSLVVQSGGKVYFGHDDIDQEISSAVQRANIFYTVKYYPTNQNLDGNLSTIQIKVDRPGMTAHTRAGYYALPSPSATSQQEMLVELKQALSSQLPYLGLPIISSSVQISNKSGQAEINLNVDSGAITWQPAANGKLEGSLIVAAADISDDGKILHVTSNQMTITALAGHGVRAHGHAVQVSATVPVSLPKGHLRIVVRDAVTGKTGTVNVDNLDKLPKS